MVRSFFALRAARAKAVVGACLTLGAADLAVIDFGIAPALVEEAPAVVAPPTGPVPAPEAVSTAAITQANVVRGSEEPPPARPVTREDYTVLFATDNARLDRAALAVLDAIEPGGVLEVSVDGYADPRGTTDYNQALSERRASVIAEALARRGVTAQRVRGMGAARRPGSAADADALRRDRRVEVHIARRNP
jgi:outer membrane protein OmpA-like peptidoglycan-associated protein